MSCQIESSLTPPINNPIPYTPTPTKTPILNQIIDNTPTNPAALLFLFLNQPLTVKLDQNNYLVWKNQLLNILISNGLEGYIDGIVPYPAHFLDLQQLQPNLAYSIWQRFNRLVMS